MDVITIYKITNSVNNMVYVGQTHLNLQKRIRKHFDNAYGDKLANNFHTAIREIGSENFSINEIEIVNDKEIANDREYFWINYYYDLGISYNMKISKGKSGGDTLSNHPRLKEIGEKISNKVMGGNNSQARKIIAYDIINNKKYTFDSMADCVRELNLVGHSIISKRCLGHIKSPYKKRWLFEFND